jgi:hypothetical protein
MFEITWWGIYTRKLGNIVSWVLTVIILYMEVIAIIHGWSFLSQSICGV